MCGILGLVIKDKSDFSAGLFKKTAESLFRLSESRGKEASGIALLDQDGIKVYKKTLPASTLIRSVQFNEIFSTAKDNRPLVFIGHTRLITNGSYGLNQNNQPVIKDGLVGVHNGIIVNDEKLWDENKNLNRIYGVDTEVILSLFRNFLNSGSNLIDAIKKVYGLIEGSASIALLFSERKELLLATNTGSIYFGYDRANKVFIYASEEYILDRILNKRSMKRFGPFNIEQVKAGTGLILNLEEVNFSTFSLSGSVEQKYDFKKVSIEIKDYSTYNMADNVQIIPPITFLKNDLRVFDNLEKDITAINSIRRCTKCVLPETMPFIEFDTEGVCNYCYAYHSTKAKGEKVLEEMMQKYRNNGGNQDCIIAFSGGRDSSYGLHYIKKVLKMNPIAYTYDWGMITDLGRRNQARMCGRLGVDHIIVSADIKTKRDNIRKNILAWLRKPDLGTVPLFMAGDKQYFYYANKLKKQTKLNITFLGSNLYEKTDFKWGFCNIKPRPEKNYQLQFNDKIKLASYYGKSYLTNPAYLNSTLLDTVLAYFSFYFIEHNYVNIFDYIKWDEKEINRILFEEYNWERAADTSSTWRIVDGTASFYNYIYYLVAGFTENDSLRSNQIREDYYTREEALSLTIQDNKPRFESIKWYCDTIGIDFLNTITKINSIPKLYENRLN